MAMTQRTAIRTGISVGAVALLAACGAPGLPPAGPKPGEVEIGYGTQEEEDVTGAHSSIKEDEVANVGPVRIEELLRGRVAGLQIVSGPGGQVRFRIRGTNSLLYDQEPLIVLDGVPLAPNSVASALSGLLPRDIRQVDVLKDVSSTAIYGTRGAGGVILITTHR
jgi:TonB-dependent SusC/RagA subfamily outer membrane receptor